MITTLPLHHDLSDPDSYVYLGRLLPTFSKEPGFSMTPEQADLGFQAGQLLFVHLRHTFVPFRLTTWQPRKEKVYLQFYIPPSFPADQIEGSDLYAWKASLPAGAHALPPGKELASCLGYQVFCQGELLGQLTSYTERPFQDLIGVTHEEKELLIPVHPAYIGRTDPQQRRVEVTLPAGYLESLS